jgi:hypothetical protein
MSSAKALSVPSRGTMTTSTTSMTAAAAGLDVEGSKDQDRRDDQSSHELFPDTPPPQGCLMIA